MLSVVMLIAVVLSVVAPYSLLIHFHFHFLYFQEGCPKLRPLVDAINPLFLPKHSLCRDKLVRLSPTNFSTLIEPLQITLGVYPNEPLFL
jgi:hypothetical protein